MKVISNPLLPPTNVVCKGYVFTCVCHSFCSQGGVPGQIPPQPWPRYTPLRTRCTPQDQVHPPPGQLPWDQVHPPGPGTPPSGPGAPPGTRYTSPGTRSTPLGPGTPLPPGPGTPPGTRYTFPRDQVHPQEIRSTRGRYASYWNAILY